jgi:hypothetical protein
MELAAWSATGQLVSQKASFDANGNVIQASGGPVLQCPFPEPGNYTVQFYLKLPAVLTGIINPVATITWSLGGNRVTRIMSVYDGASITGIAESVDVRVSDQTLPGIFSGAAQQYSVSIMVAKGTRASTFQPPTYASYIVDQETPPVAHLGFVPVLAGTSSNPVNIPQNAGVISMFVTGNGASYVSGAVELKNGDLLVIEQDCLGNSLNIYDPIGPRWVPINPQGYDLLFQNKSAINALFGVTWGIDG